MKLSHETPARRWAVLIPAWLVLGALIFGHAWYLQRYLGVAEGLGLRHQIGGDGQTQQQVDREHGIAPWKLEFAVKMFRLTTVSVPWIVRRLNAGSVSHFVKCRRTGATPY